MGQFAKNKSSKCNLVLTRRLQLSSSSRRWTRASGTTGGKGEVPSLAKEGTSLSLQVFSVPPCPAKDVSEIQSSVPRRMIIATLK